MNGPGTEAEDPPDAAVTRVGWGFITLYTAAYMGTILLFLAPALVTLALKVNSLVGIGQAPKNLALVTGTGALLSMFANPFFGRMSDRTSSRFGMRRSPRGATRTGLRCAGCLPARRFGHPYLSGPTVHRQPDHDVPLPLSDRRLLRPALRAHPERSPTVGGGDAGMVAPEFVGTFYVNPRKNPDFAWVFISRFMFVLTYSFLTTYLAYYLLDQLDTAEADVPQRIFIGILIQAVVTVAASVLGGKLSDRTGRRKVFVLTASLVYGLALFVIAVATNFNGFWSAWPSGGLGFGIYMAVDLALVTDVLPDNDNVAKDLGVLNIAGALPSSIAPAIAPVILAIGGGSYGVLYGFAGVCAVTGAFAILPVKRVR